MTLPNQNLWSCSTTTPLMFWGVYLPYGTDNALDMLVYLVHQFIHLAAQTQVFTVYDAHSPDTVARRVVQDIITITKQKETFYLFWGEERARFRYTSRISYYDTIGNIQESEVEDTLPLINQRGYGLGGIPFSMTGKFSLSSKGYVRGLEPWIMFSLMSDIWFPLIPTVENRPLANRHTPRLNHFLTIAHDLALSVGAKWD